MSDRIPQGRVPELDGLRGVAILLVFLLHYISDSAGGDFGSFLYRFRSVFRIGWSGVDLFFVLSGFLIGGILMGVRDSPNYFRTFYLRRIHRILPIYYVYVSLYPLTSILFLRWPSSPIQVDAALIHRLPLYYVFAQTFNFLPQGTLGWYWLAVSWSVAVEEQFYIIAAPVVRFLTLRRLVIALSATILVCPFLRWLVYILWPHREGLFYILMPCRADSLAIGMLTAVLWRNSGTLLWIELHRKWLYRSLAILVMGSLVFVKWFPSPCTLFAALAEYQWLAVMYACLLLIVLVDRQGMIAGVTRWSFLQELGRLSYCIYLIHLPILAISHSVVLRSSRVRIDSIPGLGATILAALLTLAIAKLSWTFLEAPMLRRGHAYTY
jgi:peptidoglycan/LPS O-acetylase OafA/YrhL